MKPSLSSVAIFCAAVSCVCVCSQKVIAAEVPGIAKEVISVQHADVSDPRSAVSRIEPADSKAATGDAGFEQKGHAISLQHNDLSAPNAATVQQTDPSLDPASSNRRLPNRSQTVIRSRNLQTPAQN
jgi:hypothetical protein